jgi:NADPH2:quinone reductase
MRAAVMQNNERPAYASFREPEAADGSLVVAVRAAALTGFDRAVARRIHYFTMPDGPFVVGKEGMGETPDGQRIYFNLEAPVPPFGSMGERTLIDPRFSFPVPDSVADDAAAALGNAGLAAWLALSWRGRLRPGETVLILGATGVSGSIAVAAAKCLGAGRVIAAGRNRAALLRALRFGADATVELTAGTDLTAAYRDAAGGTVDLFIDYLCGAPAEAAFGALALHGRIVLIGTSADTGAGATDLRRRNGVCLLSRPYGHSGQGLRAALPPRRRGRHSARHRDAAARRHRRRLGRTCSRRSPAAGARCQARRQMRATGALYLHAPRVLTVGCFFM